MDILRVRGGRQLRGEVVIGGAKNAVLPIMAASLMIPDEVVLENVPDLSDGTVMQEILAELGVFCRREGECLVVDGRQAAVSEPGRDKMAAMRASSLLWGPMLDRFGAARLPMPGGCRIGARPMDLHIEGMKRLGVDVVEQGGFILSRGDRRRGAEICLDFPSVGATENLVMAAVRAEGRTLIRNAAREPEVSDLCRFLVASGAKIGGIGDDTLEIEGVSQLHGCRYRVMGDRIVGGTVLLAAMLCGGDVVCRGVDPEDLGVLLGKIGQCGVAAEVCGDGLEMVSSGRYRAADIRTMPYPGFPTDLQPQFMAVMAKADGASLIRENVFENRFSQGRELAKMGADITLDGRCALVRGKERLCGARVEAFDLRCGAALVLAALAAEGESELSGVEYIERGYSDIVGMFGALGAEISLVKRL